MGTSPENVVGKHWGSIRPSFPCVSENCQATYGDARGPSLLSPIRAQAATGHPEPRTVGKRPEIKEGTKARFSKAKKTTKMNGQDQGDGKYGKAKLARITTCMDVVSIGTSRDSRNLP